MARGLEVEGFNLKQRHGKARVRVARVWKGKDGRDSMVEWNVSISLLSKCINAYLDGDNSDIVATDTMKNTVYAKAKKCSEQLSVEELCCATCQTLHIFLSSVLFSFLQVTGAIINIVEKPWERVHVAGQPHEHGFKLGSEKHTTEVILHENGALKITSGVQGLALLKTTKSGFEGFIRDKYTALPDTRERMLATEVTGTWRYWYPSAFKLPENPLYFTERYLDVKKVLMDTFFGHPKAGVYSPSVQSTLYDMAKAVLSSFSNISSVELKMPNIHFLPVNLSNRDKSTIVKFKDDVYLPTDEPHGSIEASLSRIPSRM
ncbi:hypothetical protein Patl1_05846 [Pistacia atlantica]|uniref:Uncharacterized protein n=1 Tax=Pistacia atlantica TaxID=434234 RepID=A0ACC1BPP8_9ROSI|nr:hypothetical protein Patl1_05846 [Pistacia atlantica]